MLRRDFVKRAAVLASARCFAPAAEPGPNLVMIVAAGWRAASLDSGGLTPNLQRLAEQGMQLERVYSCYPLEAPSQAALITGRFPFAAGVLSNNAGLVASQPSIAQHLKNGGYKTAFIGEWRLGGFGRSASEPRRHGFDTWMSGDTAADAAVDFIQQNNQGPFFLFFSSSTPRSLHSLSARLNNQTRIEVRPNIPEDYQTQAHAELTLYRALCSRLDSDIGRLLNTIDEQRQRKTVVAFTSDYGDMLGSQGLEYGNAPYEEAVRVPLIIRGPQLGAGSRNELLVSQADIMPTLLGLTGIDAPEGMQGRDLSALIAGRGAIRPESVYSMGEIGNGAEWRMVVRGLDKLVVDRDLNVSHLYNLAQDPYELENRASDPSLELKRDELTALLKDWMRRTGDGMDPSGLKRRPLPVRPGAPPELIRR